MNIHQTEFSTQRVFIFKLYLVEVVLQLALGVLGLGDALGEGEVHLAGLLDHVVGCLLQDAVHQRAQLHRVLALALGILDVVVGEVLPVLRGHRARTRWQNCDRWISVWIDGWISVWMDGSVCGLMDQCGWMDQ